MKKKKNKKTKIYITRNNNGQCLKNKIKTLPLIPQHTSLLPNWSLKSNSERETNFKNNSTFIFIHFFFHDAKGKRKEKVKTIIGTNGALFFFLPRLYTRLWRSFEISVRKWITHYRTNRASCTQTISAHDSIMTGPFYLKRKEMCISLTHSPGFYIFWFKTFS